MTVPLSTLIRIPKDESRRDESRGMSIAKIEKANFESGKDEESGLIPEKWTVEKCSSAQVKGAEGNEEKSVQ
jgi:hypothetical protein